MQNVNASEPAAVLAEPLRAILTEEQWEKISSESGVSEVAVDIVAALQEPTASESHAAEMLTVNWTGTLVRQSAVREALRALRGTQLSLLSELAV